MGVSDPTTYLRLDKVANDYYGFYSTNGDVWEFAGQYNQNLSNVYVGLMGSDGLTITEDIVDFDYFEFTPRTYNKTWEDEFNSATLNSAWSWINEDPSHWSLTDNPGFMHITTQPGGIFGGDIHNLLVTEAPSEDYQITTKATISPTESFQGAAVIVYGDVDNYVRVSRRFGMSNEVNLRHESDDVLILNIGYDETATTVYLRITKEGNVYSGFYSLDGISYLYIGQTTAALTNPKIGILSENGPSTTEIPSDYDFFRLETNANRSFLPLIVK